MNNKVLLIANEFTTILNFRMELLKALKEANYDVYIAVPKNSNNKEFEDLGCHIVNLYVSRKGKNPFEDFKTTVQISKIIKKVKPFVVLTYTIKPNVYGGFVCRLKGVPYIANITGLGTAVENEGIMQKLTIFLYKLGLKKAQKVFFQNSNNRDFMVERGMVKGPYDLLPGSGVNLNHYKALPYPDRDTIDFVFIARVMKEKGIDQYLDAAKYIRKKHSETRFHICGFCEDAYDEELMRLDEQGVIIYHGLVKDMTEIQKISACTIHPSYYPEGLSNVLLESCASARPIITTDRSGCREVIDDGVNGYICRQQDSQDLIKQIEKFLSLSWDERRDMGLAGRSKIEKKFDRQIVVNTYINEIHKGHENDRL